MFLTQSVRRVLIVASLSAVMNSPGRPANAQYDGAEPPPESLAAGFDSITPEQCEEWLNILAGPDFEGRGTGQPGHVKAAHWVAGKCAEFNLRPMGDGGTYFQMLSMSRLLIDSEQSKLQLGDTVVEFESNVSLERFNPEPVVEGTLSFVHLAGEELEMEDPQALRGKVVVLASDKKADESVVRNLLRRRPAALLQVVSDLPESGSQLKRPSGRRRSSSTSGYITQAAAQQLLESVDGEASWLTGSDDNSSQISHTEATLRIEARVYEEPASVPNVVAWLPGSDPELADEYLVIGAHLDHLGVRGDIIYPGADDNGSGSTAVLNIAKAMVTNPQKPKRSILFIWFAAEEMGLLGSSHFVGQPTVPLEKMIAMLNIDMVGRNEEKRNEEASENIDSLHLVGSKKGDLDLHELILDVNRHVQLRFEFDEEGVFGRSDQINFYRKGASVAFLFGGFHPDYHRPSDEPAKINYDKITAAAKLYYLAAHEATNHGPFPIPSEPATEEKEEAKKDAQP